jgi:hypothetical protein
MSLPIRLLPKAKAEFDAAADYYEEPRGDTLWAKSRRR